MGVSLLRVQLGLQQRDPGEALGGCIYLQGLRGRMPSPEHGPKFKNVLQRGRQASQHPRGSPRAAALCTEKQNPARSNLTGIRPLPRAPLRLSA